MSLVIKLPVYETYGVQGIDYISTYPCLSDDNDYIPVSSLMDGEVLTSKKSGKRSFLYQLNVPVEQFRTTGKFTFFSDNLLSGSYNWVRIKHLNLGENLYIGNAGIIVHICEEPYEIVPLMVMCVRTSQLFSLNRDKNELQKFSLLIDNKFLNDEQHYKLYRNVSKPYIDKVAESVDVLYTNDISKLCLHSPEVKMPKFATITEVLQYSNDINKHLA